MKTIEISLKIDELECDFEHQPYEAQTLEYPGCPESDTLIACKFRGIDIMDLLVDGDIEAITEHYTERANDAKLESRIEAYESKKYKL